MFENTVLRRVFGPKRDEVTGNGENYIMKNLVICTPYRILCGWCGAYGARERGAQGSGGET